MGSKSGKRPGPVAPKRHFSKAGEAPAKPSGKKAGKVRGRKAAKKKTRAPKNIFSAAFSWILRKIFRTIWWIGWRGFWIGVIILAAMTGFYYIQLPPAVEQVDGRVSGSVTMLDKDGKVFAWRGAQFGGLITPQTVSPFVKDAVVATEDKRFYHHFGVSPRGILSAIRINLSEGRGPLQGNGGSTITQQVAKILCLGHKFQPSSGISKHAFEAECRRTTLTRKLMEVPFAFAMELKYTKDEILMIYLNRAYLGAGAQGFEAASQRYFGKSAKNDSPAESALLAGLLVAPSYYAPTRNLARANQRAAVVLGLMRSQGYLNDQQYRDALANPAKLSGAAKSLAGGYFADWVMDAAPSMFVKASKEDVVIKTTYDARLQQAAEDALTYVFQNDVKAGSKAQAAIVVMSADGAVRAMVGGRKLDGAGLFNRATQAQRQTGSAFKPFVYGAALDLGWRYDSIIEDAPITINIPGSGPWSPRNYSGKFLGPLPLTKALAYSLNTVAVRLTEDVGRPAVRKVAHDFGLTGRLAQGPALALGASESSLLEMTGAYAGILNGGTSVKPYGLTELSLKGDTAPFMANSRAIGERVISQQADRQLVYMMNQVSEIGSGRRARLPDRKIAAKTGTTQGARDAWFIGFTADYVAGVWMGYDDNSKLTGVTGGGLPAEIWKQTMLRVDQGVPPRPLPMIDPNNNNIPPATRGKIAPTSATPKRDPAQSIIDDVLGAIFGRRRQ